MISKSLELSNALNVSVLPILVVGFLNLWNLAFNFSSQAFSVIGYAPTISVKCRNGHLLGCVGPDI